MSILNWVYIAGWMVGVIWWWSIYLKVQERGEEPLDLAGSLGAAMVLPMLIGLSIMGVGALFESLCGLGLIPALQAIVCY